MNTNGFWPIRSEYLGKGNSFDNFNFNQNQTNESNELVDYVRITDNYDPRTISLLLKGHGFGFSDEDRQRFNELYQRYGYGKEKEDKQPLEINKDDSRELNQEMFTESPEQQKERLKETEAIEVNDKMDTSSEGKADKKEKVKKDRKRSKTVMDKKVSYTDYDLIMQEQGRKGFDYMHEKESVFLRLREEALDKLLTKKFNTGALKIYLYIWKMAFKYKYKSLHWTASENEMAEELNISPNTVSSGIKQLEEHGLIKIEPSRHERSAKTYIIQPLT